ncbi:hypothetical protein OFR22_08400 [Brachyspira hyodysenteriae]|uniref:hypothetical protein n=1 Tax=Brachyspira hyodysenteriae TaxID=159 RepID=UPI0011845A42|nr:hypothetical protein [Brachyspira hyodysenteriae]MCZ9839348.1 hypothetical protein [Brachyspira hyodysenteriae]MCZ9846997.1 hypothetical protein [Brachyspira hyodysenteriae]MCZ9850829.1 hypothetical protein [Brachyspira hyodysenteriae]MCZ9860418.1 hypothetical protein [Brachyspira hyodysenteriae]MCZ9869300.1 hypothetical protein [Brachyspira hyodysenteriae]
MTLTKSKLILLIIIILLFSINAYSITITILPFLSADETWIEEYKADDGIPRVLEDSLINTKMLNVTDYDLLISYFSSYDIVASYKSMQTNIQLAADFIKETFNSDYIITGEILNFNLKKGGKDTANVEFKVNLIDINSLKTVKSFTDKGTYTLPNNSPIYSAEDALFTETALGAASAVALNKIAKNITEYLGNPPITGIITRIEDNKLYINIGKNNNIKKGDEFYIYKTDKILKLPENMLTNNISNIPKISIETNNNTKGYISARSNEKGDVWYTSEMLYKYRFYKNEETLVASAKVIEIYDYYAVLENKSNVKIEPMMIVKIKE